MTIVDINNVFFQCDFPSYKDILVKNGEGQCTIYSQHSDYRKPITIPLMNYDRAVHVLSLEIIKLRSYDMIHQDNN